MKCQVLIDWLTFSIKNTEDPAQVIQKYLGLDPSLFQEAPYGLMGYQRVLRFGDIQVLYDPRENEYFHDMGVCVSMSGNGCRAFETMSRLAIKGAKDTQGTPSTAFPTLFQLLAAEGENANISRIDIACDDREGYLCMDDIIRAVQENTINSRMMKRTLYLGYDGIDRSGTTAYIGAESSSFRVRIYDKALEQGESGHWIRVELVMKGENAQAFGQKLTNAESVGKLSAQVINDKFSFIIRDDTNITRCTVCPWWQAFVDELESVRLVARETVQHCVEHIASWVEAQVGPSLAILFQTMGFPKIFELAVEASSRLSDKQRFLIADYGINSRPTAITGGNYGIVGDNGQITTVTNHNQIINETNNTYYNPATGQTQAITDWTYNYDGRIYDITLDTGDKVSVEYGDQNITITENTVNEGDTIVNNYTIYYIIDGGSGETPGPSPSPWPGSHPLPPRLGRNLPHRPLLHRPRLRLLLLLQVRRNQNGQAPRHGPHLADPPHRPDRLRRGGEPRPAGLHHLPVRCLLRAVQGRPGHRPARRRPGGGEGDHLGQNRQLLRLHRGRHRRDFRGHPGQAAGRPHRPVRAAHGQGQGRGGGGAGRF